MICLRGNVRDRRTDLECNKKKRERETETKYNKEACKNEGMRKKNQNIVKVKQRENNLKVFFFIIIQKNAL